MLASEVDKIVMPFEQNIDSSSNIETVLLFDQITPRFYSTISVCPVTTYEIVEKSGSGYTPYSGSDLYLDSNQNLVLDTSKMKLLTLYLMAASENSTQNAYLPLYLSVNNFAPFFE